MNSKKQIFDFEDFQSQDNMVDFWRLCKGWFLSFSSNKLIKSQPEYKSLVLWERDIRKLDKNLWRKSIRYNFY